MSREFFGLGDGDIRLPDEVDGIHVHSFRWTTDAEGRSLVAVRFGHAVGLPPSDACPQGCAATRGVMEWDASTGEPVAKQRPCYVEDGRGWHECAICGYYSEPRDVIGTVYAPPDCSQAVLATAIKRVAALLRQQQAAQRWSHEALALDSPARPREW